MAAVTICSDLGAPQNKVSHFHCYPSLCHEVMGLDTMILVFWKLNFKPTCSLSSFTFIMRLLGFFLLSAIMVASSAYVRLLIFFLAILIPAYASPSPAFLMMYSAYKLKLEVTYKAEWHYIALTYYFFRNLEPVCCSMSSSNWCLLTCLQISHVQVWPGIPISLRIFHLYKISGGLSEEEFLGKPKDNKGDEHKGNGGS